VAEASNCVSAVMPRTTGGQDPIVKYEAEPPAWLTTSHSTADLGQSFPCSITVRTLTLRTGYPGFHPPRPDQEEDLLSDHNVKQGYSAAQVIGVRIFE